MSLKVTENGLSISAIDESLEQARNDVAAHPALVSDFVDLAEKQVLTVDDLHEHFTERAEIDQGRRQTFDDEQSRLDRSDYF